MLADLVSIPAFYLTIFKFRQFIITREWFTCWPLHVWPFQQSVDRVFLFRGRQLQKKILPWFNQLKTWTKIETTLCRPLFLISTLDSVWSLCLITLITLNCTLCTWLQRFLRTIKLSISDNRFPAVRRFSTKVIQFIAPIGMTAATANRIPFSIGITLIVIGARYFILSRIIKTRLFLLTTLKYNEYKLIFFAKSQNELKMFILGRKKVVE